MCKGTKNISKIKIFLDKKSFFFVYTKGTFVYTVWEVNQYSVFTQRCYAVTQLHSCIRYFA